MYLCISNCSRWLWQRMTTNVRGSLGEPGFEGRRCQCLAATLSSHTKTSVPFVIYHAILFSLSFIHFRNVHLIVNESGFLVLYFYYHESIVKFWFNWGSHFKIKTRSFAQTYFRAQLSKSMGIEWGLVSPF